VHFKKVVISVSFFRNTSIVGEHISKAFFLSELFKFRLGQSFLVNFYNRIVLRKVQYLLLYSSYSFDNKLCWKQHNYRLIDYVIEKCQKLSNIPSGINSVEISLFWVIYPVYIGHRNIKIYEYSIIDQFNKNQY